MTFTVRRMAGDINQVVVRGTDVFGVSGVTTLDAGQWNQVKDLAQFKSDTARHKEIVDEFYAPLFASLDAMKKAHTKVPDPIGYIVVDEKVDGVEGKPGHLEQLSRDSIVLRLLEQGDHDRLEWVNDQLVPMEADDVPVDLVPTAAEVGAEATGIPLED